MYDHKEKDPCRKIITGVRGEDMLLFVLSLSSVKKGKTTRCQDLERVHRYPYTRRKDGTRLRKTVPS